MTKPAKIGFLIPEYPGQTHSFFWREMEATSGQRQTAIGIGE